MINIFNKEVNFLIRDKEMFDSWIFSTIESNNKSVKEINFIFCNDDYLLKINKKYLNHDYYTDIITFDNSENSDRISADIFISYERVLENSKTLKTEIENEISRVCIHGILHLLGFNDSTEEEKTQMRKAEDKYISNKKFNII